MTKLKVFASCGIVFLTAIIDLVLYKLGGQNGIIFALAISRCIIICYCTGAVLRFIGQMLRGGDE